VKKMKKLITDGPFMSAASRLTLTFIVFLYWILDYLYLGMRIQGRKNLKSLRGKGCVVISNHTLFIEPGFITHAIYPRHPYFSIMEATFVNKIAEIGLRLLRGFPIPRRNGMARIEPEITRVLKNGGCVHVFPEGELTHFNQKPAPFKKGAFVLAIENQVPILPVATVILPRKFFGRPLWQYFFRLVMVVEKPIVPPPCPESREELLRLAGEMARESRTVISDAIRTWNPDVRAEDQMGSKRPAEETGK